MTELIDTHSHIYEDDFAPDFGQVIERAESAGVSALIMPDVDIASYDKMIRTADRLPEYAFPCIGLHPTSVNEEWETELSFLREHLHDRKFYAIGEIGLDEYWSRDFVEQQIRVFEEQVEIAAQMDLPVIIHCRQATDDLFRVLEDVRGLPLRGTMHAFTGSYETYRRILSYGDFKFGIGGVVTYKNAGIAETVRRMSLQDIVLETDCPWLTPVPYRGRRNESSYVSLVAAKVAETMGAGLEAVASATTSNARKLFKL